MLKEDYRLSESELSCDAILRGRLKLWQPRVGYRFSVDALLLADFAATQQFGRAYDLCTGSGVVALALALARSDGEIVGVELQPRLVAVARKNVLENQLQERVRIESLDLRDAHAAKQQLPGASAELVTCNPPFRPEGQGSANPDDEEAIARHEVRLTIQEVAQNAARLLVPGGRFLVVYPAERLTELLAVCDEKKLRPTRARFVHARPGEPARRVLLETRKGNRGLLVIEPPLFLADADGQQTNEARRIYGED